MPFSAVSSDPILRFAAYLLTTSIAKALAEVTAEDAAPFACSFATIAATAGLFAFRNAPASAFQRQAGVMALFEAHFEHQQAGRDTVFLEHFLAVSRTGSSMMVFGKGAVIPLVRRNPGLVRVNPQNRNLLCRQGHQRHCQQRNNEDTFSAFAGSPE